MKPTGSMETMRTDMAGAGAVIGTLKAAIDLKIRRNILFVCAIAENVTDAKSYKPGDVIVGYAGKSVEIGNTDAEGRIVLADSLAYACEQKPDLVIDFATLTGAARIALGADLPAIFSNRLEIAEAIVAAGERVEDPLWVMPLYQPYRKLLKSEIADLNNVGTNSYGGCITAALFLEHFVDKETPWVHIDTFAWNQSARPGRPVGGEALGLRAVFNYLRERYG
jgi:leucyl aminopeptidase